MKKLVIVISGLPGSGSSTIAKELAKKLDLDYFSLGFRQKNLMKGENQTQATIDTWKMKLVQSKSFHEDMDKFQIEKAKEGNVVISSKLGIHMLKDLATFTVWLDVPLEERAKRTSRRDGISVDDAKKLISERERIERKSWKKIYGFDYFDQKKEANFVLDSANLTIEQTVEKILDAVGYLL